MASTVPSDNRGSAKTVLITGVSRGCGRAMAVELARRGHTVIGCARSEAKLATLRDHECPRPNGQPHMFCTVDVASDTEVRELARRVAEAGLVPDIVVNNASIINKNNKMWEVPPEEVDVVIDANIKGTINVIRHFLPVMIDRGQGVVVNMSSIWGRTGAPDVAPYCATKWAVEGLSRAAAMEVPRGLVVVTLDPGVIYTDMSISSIGSEAASQFPTPETWAPMAVDMVLNFTADDNGSSQTVALVGKKEKMLWDSLEKKWNKQPEAIIT